MKKRCSKCKEKKDRKEFHKNKSKSDGLQGWCKDCCISFRKTPFSKKAEARYWKTKKGKSVARRYSKSKKGKASEARKGRKYRQSQSGKEKTRSRKKLHYEIDAGRMPRANILACACGAPAREYHHPDYSKPLDVVALCRPCHVGIHQ